MQSQHWFHVLLLSFKKIDKYFSFSTTAATFCKRKRAESNYMAGPTKMCDSSQPQRAPCDCPESYLHAKLEPPSVARGHPVLFTGIGYAGGEAGLAAGYYLSRSMTDFCRDAPTVCVCNAFACGGANRGPSGGWQPPAVDAGRQLRGS